MGNSSPLRAQDALAPDAVSITGRVLDAYVGGSLPGAEVALVPYDSAAPLPDSVNDDFLRRRRHVARLTDGDGGYRFADVSPGVYLVAIRRPGFRPAIIRVTHAEMDTRVSVALELDPISLEPVKVQTRAPLSDWIDVHGRRAVGTLPVERLRQKALLASDARVVSAEDVRQAATPGEADVFRTLHRLPGVSTRDDWSAEIWTRGASFGETRVYLDGLPLFNPLHAFGLLSGMSSHGIGPTVFQPGVRSAAYPEGAAAVVDITSRSGRQAARLEGGAEATLASLQAWGAGSVQEGRGGWQLAGRNSWIDVGQINPAQGTQGPFIFSDLNGRIDLGWSGGARLSASAFFGSDHNSAFWDDRTGSSSSSRTWLGSIELAVPVGGLRLTQSIGATGDDHRSEDASVDANGGDHVNQVVDYARYAGEIADDGASPWRAGYDVTWQSSRYDGPIPWPYDWRPTGLPTTSWDRSLTLGGVWAEYRWAPVSRLEIQASTRVAAKLDPVSSPELLPTVVARWSLTPNASLSAGAGRYLQYAQSPAPLSAFIAGPITGGRIWTVDPSSEPMDSRVVTLGGEAWLGESVLLSATAYRRSTSQALLPNPSPGLLAGRQAIVEGGVDAKGVELSLRRLSGRVTGSASYSFSRAVATAEGHAFRPATDRRHLVDLAAHLKVTGAVRVSGMFSFASGAPYASVEGAAVVEPCSLSSCLGVGPSTSFESPFDRTTPSYSSLDLALDWSRTFGNWGLGMFAQVQNAFLSKNDVTYRGSRLVCENGRTGVECVDGASAAWLDDFYHGISLLPLLGVRIGF